MFRKTKAAFTLVELIVVITILAILGTIAFISFQGYSKSSRDSVRVVDLTNINKSLELYLLQTSQLPVPDDSTDVIFSGAVVWSQGVFGDKSTTSTRKLNKTPKDPLLELEYTYSKTKYGNEYQIGAIMEGDLVYDASPLLGKTHAAAVQVSAYVTGNYNQQFVRTSTGGLDYVLGVPSIISTDLSDPDIVSIVSSKKLSYKGYNNLPAGYASSNLDLDGGFDFTNANIVVYQGSLADLTQTGSQNTFVTNLQNTYSGGILEDSSNYVTLLNVDTSDRQKVINLVANYTNNGVGGFPELGLSVSSEASPLPNLSFISNLLGYWNFESITSSEITEVSGESVNAVNVNNVTSENSVANAQRGNYGQFNGTNQHVEIPNYNFSSGGTLSVWVKLDNLTTDHAVFGQETPFEFQVWFDNAGTDHFATGLYNGSWQRDFGTVVPGSTDWYHIVFTYDGSIAKHYVDGVEDGSVTATVGDVDTGNIWVGAVETGGKYWDGQMDEIMMFDKVLSPAEVLELYNEQK